jgi:hypothetical protein
MGSSATAAQWQYFQDTEVIAAGAAPKNELTASKRGVTVSGTTSVGVAAVLVGDVDGSWRPSQTTAQVDPTYYTSLVSSLQATDKSVTLARWGMEDSGASTTKKVVSRTYQDGIETLTYSDGSQVKSGATKLSASLSIDGLFKYLTYLFPDDTENNAIQQVSGTTIPSVTSNEGLRTLSTPLGPYRSGVDIYSKGDYSILNNLWGITPDLNLKNGTDYLSTIKYSPASLQSNVTFLWKFPDILLDAQGSKLYAYPEIGYGKPLPLSGYNNPGAAIAQLKSIKTFEVEYSVTLIGDSSNYSLMHDLWIFDEKGVISGELGIYPQPDYWTTFWNGPNGYFSKLTGAETYIYTDNGYQWNLVASPKKNMQEVDSWWYLMTPKDKNQSSPKKIDILKIIQFLFSKGKINPDHYVRGIELGNEIHKGTGGMIIHDYAVTFVTK